MTRHLFIGGANDGRYFDVTDGVDYFRVARPRPVPALDFVEVATFDGAASEVDLYRREYFRIGRAGPIAAEIFVHQRLTTDAMFQTLLDGYRQGVPTDPGEAYEEGYRHGMRGAVAAVERMKSKGPEPTVGDVMLDVVLRVLRAVVAS